MLLLLLLLMKWYVLYRHRVIGRCVLEHVSVWLCDCVSVLLCVSVIVCQCDCVSVWLCVSVTVCQCDCVSVWLCVSVIVCQCDCVSVLLCVSVTVSVWLCVSVIVCQCDCVPVWLCVSVVCVSMWFCVSVIACHCNCVFLAEGNDAKVSQVFAENYETHQTREMFHENFLQSPLGFASFWCQVIYTDNKSCNPLHKGMEV